MMTLRMTSTAMMAMTTMTMMAHIGMVPVADDDDGCDDDTGDGNGGMMTTLALIRWRYCWWHC